MKHYDATKIDLENLPILPFVLHKSSEKGKNMRYKHYTNINDVPVLLRDSTKKYRYAVIAKDINDKHEYRLFGLRSTELQATKFVSKIKIELSNWLFDYLRACPDLTEPTALENIKSIHALIRKLEVITLDVQEEDLTF